MRRFFKINNIEFFFILGFFISAFSFSIIISSSYRSYRIVVEKNNFNKDYKLIDIVTRDNTKEITGTSLFDFLEGSKLDNVTTGQIATTFQVGDDFIVNKVIGVCKGVNIENYSSIEGRNFTDEEKKSNKKVAIIGTNLKKYAVNNGDKLYIKIFDENYEVIGVMKDSEAFKESSIVPIKSLSFIDSKTNQFKLLIGTNQIDTLKKIKNSELEFSIQDIPHQSIVKYLFKNVAMLKDNIYGIMLGIINLMLFSFFFAHDIKPKIAIMKVLGAKNIDIYKEIFGKIAKISILGITSGLICSKITIWVMNFGKVQGYGYKPLDIYNVLITTLLIFIISIIVSLVILSNVIKFKLLKDIR